MKLVAKRQRQLLEAIELTDTDGGGVSFSVRSELANKTWADHILKVIEAGQDIDRAGMYQLEMLENEGYLNLEFKKEWQSVYSLTPKGHQRLEFERGNVFWQRWPRQLLENFPTIIFSVITALIIGWALKLFGPT